MSQRLATLQQQYNTALETHKTYEQETAQSLQNLQQLHDTISQKDTAIGDMTSQLKQAVADRDAASLQLQQAQASLGALSD